MSPDRPSREDGGEDAVPQSSQAGLSGWLASLISVVTRRPATSTREDIEEALLSADGASEFTAQERAILRNVLGFRKVRVADVMVPRADIIAVSAETSLGELLQAFRTAGHSRLPIYGETLDDPKGMVHIRDVIDHIAAKADTRGRRRKTNPETPNLGRVDLSISISAARILRPVLYVPPSMPAISLLRRMQTMRTHMALVIDEYGGTDGLVSIEDLVEAVVGEIEDEHDDDEAAMIAPAGDGSFVANARADLDDVSTAIGIDLSTGESAEDVDTIGGLVVTLAGRVPTRGELIAGPGAIEFEVLDADPRRLKRIRIHPVSRALRARRARPAQETPSDTAQDAAPEPPAARENRDTPRIPLADAADAGSAPAIASDSPGR